jgi:metal-responsive CopG/Arc/MetJ family transcriptional regulator
MANATNHDKTRVNVFLPNKLLHACKTLAKLRATSYSEIVRQATAAFVVAELKKERDSK